MRGSRCQGLAGGYRSAALEGGSVRGSPCGEPARLRSGLTAPPLLRLAALSGTRETCLRTGTFLRTLPPLRRAPTLCDRLPWHLRPQDPGRRRREAHARAGGADRDRGPRRRSRSLRIVGSPRDLDRSRTISPPFGIPGIPAPADANSEAARAILPDGSIANVSRHSVSSTEWIQDRSNVFPGRTKTCCEAGPEMTIRSPA